MQQRVGDGVYVDLAGLADFRTATTAAAFGVRGVVQALGGVNHGEPAVDGDSLESRAAAFHGEAGELVHGGEKLVGHGDLFQSVGGEGEPDLARKRGVPRLVRAAGTGENEAAVLEVTAEVGALDFAEHEVSLAGEDAERGVEDLVLGEENALEFRGDAEAGFFGGIGQEFVGEADRGLVFTVDQISAMDGFRGPVEGSGGSCERGGEEECE